MNFSEYKPGMKFRVNDIPGTWQIAKVSRPYQKGIDVTAIYIEGSTYILGKEYPVFLDKNNHKLKAIGINHYLEFF